MSSVLHRTLEWTPPTAVAGEGNYLIDHTGKRYLDACGGAAVSCLGHDNAKVREALKAELDTIAFTHNGFFTNRPSEELAQFLIDRAPSGTGRGRVMYLGSGSEAMEAALKLARQYHLERNEPKRSKIIARAPSYHGNTLGALATGGHAGRRGPFQPLLMDVSHIEAAYEYRMRREGEAETDFALRMANLLEKEIQRLGAETVMAFVAEPVVGASLGTQPAPMGYFKRIREICDQYGVLLILDEVMCGMCRTGYFYACEADGVRPDILTIAKGLGAGYQPIGAMLCSANIYQAIEKGSGFFLHGHTYLGHPVACAAAYAVVTTVLEENLIARVTAQGLKIKTFLEDRFGNHPHIGDIRGRGLFLGMEFVADRSSKTPFPHQEARHNRFKLAAFEAGLICYPMGGTVDGKLGDHVLIAPPFIISDNQIDEIDFPVIGSETIDLLLVKKYKLMKFK